MASLEQVIIMQVEEDGFCALLALHCEPVDGIDFLMRLSAETIVVMEASEVHV